jgi:hypothetical protein
MWNLLRRLFVPALTISVVAGVWSLAVVKNELELPLPSNERVDPAVVQKAVRASYSSARADNDARLDTWDASS